MLEPVDEPAVEHRRASGSTAGHWEERYRGLLEGLLELSPDAITLSDCSSRRFLGASRSFCALTGYSREELIGRTATEVGLIADDAQRSLVSTNADRRRAGPSEIEIRCKDGTVRALEISIQLMADDEVALTISRDVTDREQSEREIAAVEARLRSAAESTPDGIAIISPVRDEGGDLVDFCFTYVNDAYCRLVRLARERLLGRRMGEVFTGFTSSDRFAACREVLLTGEPSRDKSVASANAPVGPRTILDVTIASLGAELVISARDVTARHLLEAQLHASEQRFQAAVGAMLDSLVIFSPVHDDRGEIVDFRYEYANDAYCALVERDRDQLLGRAVGELFASFRSKRLEFYRQVAVTGEPVTSELLGVQGVWAGTVLAERAFDVMVAPIGENLVVSYRDVTDRWIAQQAHAAAEVRFRDVIESAPDAIVIIDADGEIQLVNAQTETLFGYTREELIGQTNEVLVPELLRDRHREHRATYTKSPRARPMGDGLELCARRKDGSEFPVEISLSPLRDENETLICSTIRDVTARRQAEQELALRAELLDLAHDAVIVFDPLESRVSFWNREAQAVYGYSAAEAIGQVTHELLATVFPDSREVVDEALARDGQWSGELWHVRKDGREILVSSRQALQRDADGRALAIIELNSDITAQRQAENELRASRARLTEAERTAGIGSWEQDLSDDSVAFSDGMLAIYGLSADQFDGTSEAAHGLVAQEDQALVRQALGRAIAERSSYSVEYRAIRADGRVRHLRGYGDVVVNDNGQPIRVVGVVQDISDAKLAQEALQSTSAELGRRANELQQLALGTAQEPSDIPHAPLTARQLEIMRLVAAGLTNAAIGERLFLASGTVKWHISQILTKTNSRTRAEAIARILGTPQ